MAARDHRLYFLPVLVCALVLFARAPLEDARANSDMQVDDSRLMTETLHILGGARNRVPRWNDTVRLAMVGISDAQTTDYVKSLVSLIALYTGLDYKVLQHGYADAMQYQVAVAHSPQYDLAICSGYQALECANFIVIVASQSTMHQIARSMPMRSVYQTATAGDEQVACFFSPGVVANFEIKRSIVFVNSALDRQMLHTCLQEEIFQSFGLFNDYTESRYFSFNNLVSPKPLTAYDKILLSSLYDRALPIGSMAPLIASAVVDYCRSDC